MKELFKECSLVQNLLIGILSVIKFFPIMPSEKEH